MEGAQRALSQLAIVRQRGRERLRHAHTTSVASPLVLYLRLWNTQPRSMASQWKCSGASGGAPQLAAATSGIKISANALGNVPDMTDPFAPERVNNNELLVTDRVTTSNTGRLLILVSQINTARRWPRTLRWAAAWVVDYRAAKTTVVRASSTPATTALMSLPMACPSRHQRLSCAIRDATYCISSRTVRMLYQARVAPRPGQLCAG